MCFRVSIRVSRRLLVYLLPLSSLVSLDLRVFETPTTWFLSTEPKHVLSYTSFPPQRFAPMPGFPFGLDADSVPKMEALASLPVPSAFFKPERPFFHSHSVRAFDHRYLGDQRSRSQGLATLSTMSAFSIPGSLFQPPTLMGFTLQSFSP